MNDLLNSILDPEVLDNWHRDSLDTNIMTNNRTKNKISIQYNAECQQNKISIIQQILMSQI
jgi:hypothetical protein